MPQGKPHSINEYVSVKEPPHLDRLTATTHQESTIEPVTIDVDDAPNGFVPGFLHMPPNFTAPDPFQVHHRTAAILSPEPAAASRARRPSTSPWRASWPACPRASRRSDSTGDTPPVASTVSPTSTPA